MREQPEIQEIKAWEKEFRGHYWNRNTLVCLSSSEGEMPEQQEQSPGHLCV